MFIGAEDKIDTIKALFEISKAIRIPVYQRAYSWEIKHCMQYLNDLLEQNGKKYYLGQLLFEVDGNIFYIIDGQQRLTTSVIFFSALSKQYYENGKTLEDIETLYLGDKFRTIKDDQPLFKRVIRKHHSYGMEDAETLSQRRILDAYKYFCKELPSSHDLLEKLKFSLEESLISTFFIDDKIKATQIFEYQNNRGKDPSSFEVIKAFLLNQIYVNSEDNDSANAVIKDIESNVSIIYRNLEATESLFSEADLLNIFCDLFWSIQGNISSVKEKLGKAENKIEWVNDFFEGFEEITTNAKSIISSKNIKGILNLFFVGNEANWKTVLIALFNKGDNEKESFESILKLLEVLCFKLKLGDFRTDYLPKYARQYFREEDSFETLLSNIREAAIKGFKWYWNDDERFENIIINYFTKENYHYNRNVMKFVLWQYENDIRESKKSGALLDKDLFDHYTIEHIAPQTPDKIEYSDDFIQNYLHKAGNLALLTQEQNSKFRNKSFEIKKELFQDTALSSYTEIRACEKWGEDEIQNRHDSIVEFVKRYFDLSGS